MERIRAVIDFGEKDRIGRLVIRRPEAGNAFTGAMVKQLHDAINAAAGRVDIAVLSGAGADFTLGRDRQEPKSGAPFDSFSAISALNKAIADFPGILVAAVRGRAFGLGVGLTMRADIAIAADDAVFALDEVKLGIPPMFIMEEIFEHMPSKHALDAVLTSREFNADSALRLGLVSRVVRAADFDGAVETYISDLASRDRSVLLACKSYMRSVRALPVQARSAFALVEQSRFALAKH